jgi:hypothetical protein
MRKSRLSVSRRQITRASASRDDDQRIDVVAAFFTVRLKIEK